jgi:hypothetical protein
MRKTFAALIALVCIVIAVRTASPASGFVTFEREYRYAAGPSDNLITCRMIALEQVKRLLLEELGTYLESNTEVRNFTLTRDKITIITAGIVRTTIIDETWDKKTYYLKARITADPDDVTRKIDAFRKDRQKSEELWAARRLYDAAHIALRSGKIGEAEALLKRVVLEYPRTDVAPTAAEHLNKIAEIKQFEMQKLDALAEIELRKFRTILEAYYVDWMRMPSSLNDLKQALGQYYRTANGVQLLYFPSNADPSRYQYILYSYHVSGKQVAVYKSEKPDIEKVEKSTGILEQLAATYRQRETSGPLAILEKR